MELHRLHHSVREASSELLQFLDRELRQDAGHSLRDEYPSLFRCLPGGESFILRAGERIVSHVGVLVRQFRHQSVRFKVGLIGSVVTSAEFRGQGLASRLIAEAGEVLRRRGAVVGLLWSDLNEFYSRAGFSLAGREIDLRFSPTLSVPVGVQAVTYEPARHARALWRLYLDHDVRLDRSLEEHARLMSVPRARVFVTEREGKPVSYLVVNKGADFEDYVHEWAGPVDEVARNLAWVQAEVFPDRPLTLIAPAHRDLGPLRKMASAEARGALGRIKALEPARLLSLYHGFLKGRGIGEKPVPLTDAELLRLVFGAPDEPSPPFPPLPFFLWGFDSI